MVTNILKLIRWNNLIIIALLMVVIRHFIFEAGLPGPLFSLQLSFTQFALLVLSVILIAAGGNIVNDIYDQETDEINKPHKKVVGTHFGETAAWILYLSFTAAGIAIAYFLTSTVLLENDFLSLHLISIVLLFVYSSKLKKTPILGNLSIALLAAFIPLTMLAFEYPLLTYSYATVIDVNLQFGLANPFQYMFDWSFYLALFAFITTLVRELIKDIEDIEGDQQTKAKTLAVKIGIEKTRKVAIALSVLTVILVLATAFKFSIFERNRMFIIGYQLLTVVGFIVYSIVKLQKASTKEDFHFVSNLWKVIMLAGFGTCIISYLF